MLLLSLFANFQVVNAQTLTLEKSEEWQSGSRTRAMEVAIEDVS